MSQQEAFKFIRPNSYGVIAPQVDRNRISRLETNVGETDLILGIVDSMRQIGILANLRRATLTDESALGFIGNIIERLGALRATQARIEVMHYVTEDADRRFFTRALLTGLLINPNINIEDPTAGTFLLTARNAVGHINPQPRASLTIERGLEGIPMSPRMVERLTDPQDREVRPESEIFLAYYPES